MPVVNKIIKISEDVQQIPKMRSSIDHLKDTQSAPAVAFPEKQKINENVVKIHSLPAVQTTFVEPIKDVPLFADVDHVQSEERKCVLF